MSPDPKNLALRIVARGLAGHPADIPPVVLLKDGKVAAVGQAALDGAADDELRLENLWLAPAPLDTHVHLHFRGDPAENHKVILNAGVVAVRDLGRHPRDAKWREDEGELPLVRWAGVGMSATGPGRYWLSRGFSGPGEFATEAERLAHAGVSVLKIFASGLLDFDCPGRVCHPGVVSPAEIKAVVAVGKEYGIPVAVHVNGDQAVGDCIRAGVDSIEHGYFMTRETLTELAHSNTSWCPTLAAVDMHARDPEGRHDEATLVNLRQIVDSQKKNMRLADEMGVNLVMGSDSGSYALFHDIALLEEAKSWLEAGLKPETVFAACTSRAAKLMGFEGRLGEIAEGVLGLLAGTREDPLQNPLALFEPAWKSY